MSSPLDVSGTEKPCQIQENLMAYMRLFAGLPGVMLYDAELFWLVSNQPAPGNMILRTHFAASGVEEQIDATLEHIGQYSDQIDWLIFPGDQPADLGKRLEARGMPGGSGGNWLWTDLTRPQAHPAMPDHFRVEQVRTDQMLSEWIRVSEAGFGSRLALFSQAYARHGYGPDAFSWHYIGYADDTPVTSGTLLNAGGCAAIYDVSTPPAFRHQGFGGAITHALMEQIQNLGYADTWIWSSQRAKSVYQKLGYIEIDFGLREHSWHRR